MTGSGPFRGTSPEPRRYRFQSHVKHTERNVTNDNARDGDNRKVAR
jgi:hypothetical protein